MEYLVDADQLQIVVDRHEHVGGQHDGDEVGDHVHAYLRALRVFIFILFFGGEIELEVYIEISLLGSIESPFKVPSLQSPFKVPMEFPPKGGRSPVKIPLSKKA